MLPIQRPLHALMFGTASAAMAPPSIRFSINGRRRPALAQAMAATPATRSSLVLYPRNGAQVVSGPGFHRPKPPVATAPWTGAGTAAVRPPTVRS